MEIMTKRPRVFISSTIEDLHDLRSALRYLLEEVGYEVQMSEYNDFAREADADTLQSCLANVRDADYYLLLVSGRRGSWVNEGERLTVTRQRSRQPEKELRPVIQRCCSLSGVE